MEEILKKYGISKQLFLKVTQFIKLQVDQNIVHTLTDQKQIAAEILIMASEGMNVKTGEKQCNLPVVSVAKHPLPRPLECWNKARELDCGDYIEWHLNKERGNAR